MKGRNNKRSQKGQGIIEATVGLLCLIVPLALGMMDAGFYALSASLNRTTVKSAARAAANCKTSEEAEKAAKAVIQKLQQKLSNQSLITLETPEISFDKTQGAVTVVSVIHVMPPMPVWFLNGNGLATFRNESMEPIVALAPSSK